MILLMVLALMPFSLAHEGDEHGHHHEPHHWESVEMRHELLAQLGGMGVLGMVVGGYYLLRGRRHTP